MDNDSTTSPFTNNNHDQNHDHLPLPLPSNPLMHGNTPQSYAFNESVAPTNPTFTTSLVPIPLSSFSSRNLLHGESSSSSNSTTQLAWLNNSPTMEDIVSAMGGLGLTSNPVRRQIAPGTNNLSGDYLSFNEFHGRGNDQDLQYRLMLRNMRVQAAALAYTNTPFSCSGSWSGSSTGSWSGSSSGSCSGSCSAFCSCSVSRGNNNNSGITMEKSIPRPRSLSSLGGASFMNGQEGVVISMAREQCGCRILQAHIDEGNPEVVQFIVSEVMDHCLDLMTNPYGNYLIQKIFEAKNSVNPEQIDTMLHSIFKDEHKLKRVCFNDHGTRVVQHILKNLRTQRQFYQVAYVIKCMTVPLMKNSNASYVIEEFVKTSPMAYTKAIFDEVARNCLEIATDKTGCSSIQRCMTNAPFGETKEFLVNEIISNSAILAQDQFGNYVVQYLIKLNEPLVHSMIVSKLGGKYVQLCLNKCGSNVIEDLLRYSDESDLGIIVEEIMNDPRFLNVAQDSYGNFVIQRALEYSKGYLLKKLVRVVLSNHGNLRSHLYGRFAFQCAKRMRYQ